ncbi:MAG: hypothetical protein GY754_38840 [bacterium]|nr:hypothetical protein [bacterium]
MDMFKGSKLEYQLPLIISALIIVLSSTWISLHCWNSFGICFNPDKVEWTTIALFDLMLISGPVSGLFLPLLSNQDLRFDWIIIIGVTMILSYGPIVFYLKTRKYAFASLGFGTLFWIFSAWFINIGIQI